MRHNVLQFDFAAWKRAAACVLILCCTLRAGADEAPTEAGPPQQAAPLALRHLHEVEALPDGSRDEDNASLDWFVFIAGVNVYPKLESEKLIDNLFEPAMQLIAPGYGGVRTISDLRDQGLLWPPHLGIGRVLTPKLAVFVQGGYSAGKVRTQRSDTSIFLLPLHTDFEIMRGAGYLGFGVDYYPWGMPELRRYETVGERLKAARFALGARLTATYATFDAKVRLALRPFPNIGIRLSDGWLVPSANFNAGVDVPLTRNSMLFANAGVNYFWKRAYDFGGPSFTLGWKYFFDANF